MKRQSEDCIFNKVLHKLNKEGLMAKPTKFYSEYEKASWLMFKESGNPYLASEMMRERRRFEEKELDR